MSYVTQYRRAFASLQGEKLTQAMVGLLRDSGHEGFGETAAFVLLDRWAATDQRGRERFHGNKAQFAEAEERRAERSSLTSGAPIGDAIFDVVESLLQPDAELAQLQHALKLARVAVTMPYVRREALIERLLAVPVPNVYKFEFLAALARNGETLPSGAVMAGVQDLRAEAQTRPGILVNEHATLFSWLPLLAFSDQPSLLLEVVRQLPDAARHPRRLDDAVSALGYARGPEVERVLRALADHDAQFFDDREWVTALERHDSPTTWEYLLDALAAGKFRSSGGIDRWGFAKALAAKMDQDPLMREAVYRRLDGAADGLERSVLIGAVEETPDEEGILLLVRTSARHNEQPVGKFRLALENVVIARRPVEGWQDAFELEGQPASELRRKLFAMVINGAREAEVAKTCLTVIDKLRDQHGAVLAEPRHPEIATGRPWPII